MKTQSVHPSSFKFCPDTHNVVVPTSERREELWIRGYFFLIFVLFFVLLLSTSFVIKFWLSEDVERYMPLKQLLLLFF